MAGRDAVHVAPQPRPQRVALGRAHDAQGREGWRPCRPASEAVVKMKGRARLTSRSTNGGAGHEAAERAERLGQRADPDRLDAVERGIGAEHGVGLVEHEQGAVPGADGDQVVDGRHVAVHREHGVVTTIARSARPRRPAGRSVVHVAMAVDGDLAPAEPGSRR